MNPRQKSSAPDGSTPDGSTLSRRELLDKIRLGSVIVGAAWVAPAIVAVSFAEPAAASGSGGGLTGVGGVSVDAVFPQQPGSSSTATTDTEPASPPLVAPSTATTLPEPPTSVASSPETETSPSAPSLIGGQAPGLLANTGVDIVGAVAIGSALTAAGVAVTRAARQPQRQPPTGPERPAD